MTLFWPENAPFAMAIIALIAVLFAAWVMWWLRVTAAIGQAGKEVARSDEIPAKLADETIPAAERLERALADAKIRSAGPLGHHVRSIYEQGERAAALQLTELNRRTIELVTGGETALRTFLSTFVIMGLLGTLAGIASAVAAFGGDQPSAQDMLRRLPGAFTPSLYGVAVSIIGSLLLVSTRRSTIAFSTALRTKTIDVLVPKLMPTNSERIDHAATRAVAAAQHVVKFAESIEARSEQLDASLVHASGSATAISNAMKEMATAVSLTGESVERSMQRVSGGVHQFALTLDRFAAFRDSMQEHERKLVQLLEEMREVSKQNANAARELMQGTRMERSDLLNAMRELNVPVRESAEEIARISQRFAEVCSELTQDVAQVSKEHAGTLAAEFTSWRQQINEGAGAAVRSLDGLRAPFEQSAEGLREQAALSIRQMSTLTRELREELSKRGLDLVESISVVVEPLREIAGKNGQVNGAAAGTQNSPNLRLSEDDWTRLEGILMPPRAETAVAICGNQNTKPGGEDLGRAISVLDGELKSLNGAVRDLTEAVKQSKRRGWFARIWKRKGP